MQLDTNNHSVFKLNYHLIMVVKYRRKVIDDTISTRLKAIFEHIGANYHVSVKEWNHDRDHVHVLMTTKPNTELSKFINAYKSASSRRIKKEFPQMRQELWKEYFWSQSYCLLTVGGAPLEILKQYIETQGQN
ncbi:IS200/IS605 family transposase [Microbacteriaceae bacterium 4G12]